jgi:hypothetical protein
MIESIILLSTGICCYTSIFGYYAYIINKETQELEINEEQFKIFKNKKENSTNEYNLEQFSCIAFREASKERNIIIMKPDLMDEAINSNNIQDKNINTNGNVVIYDREYVII